MDNTNRYMGTHHTSSDTPWCVDTTPAQPRPRSRNYLRAPRKKLLSEKRLPPPPCLPIRPTSLGLELLRCPAVSRFERSGTRPGNLTFWQQRVYKGIRSQSLTFWSTEEGLKETKGERAQWLRWGGLEGYRETICLMFCSLIS